MSEHPATLTWELGDAEFQYKTYSREHRWDFGHGRVVNASAAVDFLGDEQLVDPEQAFTASLASCHALTFLTLCSLKKLTVERYVDRAVGFLEKGEDGKPWLARVELRPETTFAEGVKVDSDALAELHDRAHHECFLANSVKTEITTIL